MIKFSLTLIKQRDLTKIIEIKIPKQTLKIQRKVFIIWEQMINKVRRSAESIVQISEITITMVILNNK